MFRLPVLAALSVLAAIRLAAADPKNAKPADANREPAPVVTEHTITLHGQEIKYRAVAGYYYLKDSGKGPGVDDDGVRGLDGDGAAAKAGEKPDPEKPKAKIFYVSYTREGVSDPGKRPITYAFNGGPGSASIWLHLGALGPREPVLSDRGEAPPPPYGLRDNPNSWLDDTDLVFIDPMSTGYSRPTEGVKPTEFYGYGPDLASVGDFIRLYTSRNSRWLSPKFICGESYGTTRAAGLSQYLQDRYHLYVNGIILVSSVLNFETLSFRPGNDTPYPLFLPTYAASAWYHRRLAPDLQNQPLSAVLAEAERFAAKDYPAALLQGSGLGAAEKHRAAEELHRLTGLPVAQVEQWNLRIRDALFFTWLLRDRDRQVGRYDSRFQGIRINPGTDDYDFDPSYEAVSPTFVAGFNDYIRRELKFESDLPYEALTAVQPWPLAKTGYLDVAEALRSAMTRNPYLKVWVCCGYYDLATPYFAAKTTTAQMELDPAVRSHLTLTYYPAGHMIYIDRPSQNQFKRDFESFLASAVLPESATVPSAAP